MAAPEKEKPENEIDDEAELYNRQIYILGHEGQKKLKASNVLIAGFDGLAIEVAKNLILGGIGSVTLLDNQNVRMKDLGSMFYLEENQIGQNKVEAALPKLRELNRYVNVESINGEVSAGLLESGKFPVFVAVGFSYGTMSEYNDLCRQHGVKFIGTAVHGVFGSVFVDLGDSFHVSDVDGEQPRDGIISNIQVKADDENITIITVHEDERHQLSTGDMVRFEEIEGMGELNDGSLSKIKVISPFVFEIERKIDVSLEHEPGTGRFIQVKQPATVSFVPMKDAGAELIQPFDYCKMMLPLVHHGFSKGLGNFRTKNSRYPSPTSKEDADEVLKETIAMMDGVELDEAQTKTVLRLARCSSAVINPMATLFGGIVAQEVLKVCTAKFTPIQQFLYLDIEEALPENEFDNLSDFAATNCRYDDLAACVGQQLLEKVKNLHVFMVGAGAIGCEMLKNFALTGVACGTGNLHITDMDVIEKSNLSRQFLFRNDNIGQLKSETAAAAAQAMNTDFNVQFAANRVGKESEAVYNTDFWEGLDMVVTALDNIDARLYLDNNCVHYTKPMLDSGTVGTKGSTQMVVPFKTESYGSQSDPPNADIPLCLLKHFPNRIEHTIQWARDDFEGLFTQIPDDVNKYLTQPDYINSLRKDPISEFTVLTHITAALGENFVQDWQSCVIWAVRKFTEHFDHQIKQLLHKYPANHLSAEGQKFWSGPKRAPTPIEFNVNDDSHIDFVFSAAAIYAKMYCIEINSNVDHVRSICADMNLLRFVPKDEFKIATTEKEAKENAKKLDVDIDEVETLRKSLPDAAKFEGFSLNMIDFEKDDPTNHHIDYVTACSNLRARNYAIEEKSAHETKRIAGRIIPAIATTTAMVTGLVIMEMLKIVQDKPVESYRNAFCNLALPLFTLSEPKPCDTNTVSLKTGDWAWSLWDKIKLNLGNCTLGEFLDHFEDTYGVELSVLTYGPAILYADWTSQKKLRVRKKMTMTQLIHEVAKKDVPMDTKELSFEVSCVDMETDEDLEMPTIILKIQ